MTGTLRIRMDGTLIQEYAIQDMTIAQQNVEVLGYRYLSV